MKPLKSTLIALLAPASTNADAEPLHQAQPVHVPAGRVPAPRRQMQ